MKEEWITVIIVLLILAILLDGMRRMRNHRRDHLRMKHRTVAKADSETTSDLDPAGSEFPSGGARVAAYRDPDHAVTVNKTVKQLHTASRWTRGAPANRIPEQVSLNLDTPVPMLMDSVEDSAEHSQQEQSPQLNEVEPTIGDLSNLEDDDLQQSLDHADDYSEIEEPQSEPEPDPVKVESKKPAEKPREQQPEAPKEPDEVLIINVMARRGELFPGPALLEAFVSNGMRFGDMDIFHRHESEDGRGRILFSAANMVVPGTFDLSAMDDFTTPGISMFLSLPIASDSLAAYNLMASTAHAIAEALGGELKDENRSVMTRQTIEHGRQRVIEYERKRRLAKS